jgi:hypothetical protein
MKDRLNFLNGEVVISPEVDNRIYLELLVHFFDKYPNEYYEVFARVLKDCGKGKEK